MQIYCFCSKIVTMVTAKYHSCISDLSDYSSMKFSVHIISGPQTEIFETVYCLVVHLSFLTSYNPLFFSLCKTSKKNIFGFSVTFSWKTVQISICKVEYLENSFANFNDFGLILQDFERPFRWNQLVLQVLQFSFNPLCADDFCEIWAPPTENFLRMALKISS